MLIMELYNKLLELSSYYYFLLIVSPLLLVSLIYRYRWNIHYGSLPITSESVAFNQDKYKHIIRWDKRCFYIKGIPTVLCSGEFHYWRVPDRERWESILKMYVAGGLNCIRIYFHWGYHSPAQNKFIFDGNRDIDYLLQLCTKLNLYVLAAPGPYICAETQAGGFPAYLVATNTRLRHSVTSLWKRYDESFSEACRTWLNAILPILATHQITENPNGCIIALQLENENFEHFKYFPLGLHDEMRFLAKCARDNKMTVPFFSNDGMEEGSFIIHPEHPNRFGLDLYGFDKYVVFVPSSDVIANVLKKGQSKDLWKPWDYKNISGVNGLEKRVRKLGGHAAKTPILIPELQGGWFNHYRTKHTYDDIYTWYGAAYTRSLVERMVKEGVTAMSIYMYYGGTNWGTLGDPDVYTSYDYSACIREFGYISERARLLRLTYLFLRSFSPLMAQTDAIEYYPSVHCNIEGILVGQRMGIQELGEITFLHNLSQDQIETISLIVENQHSLQIQIPYKSSFMALGNYYPTTSNFRLVFSSCPIHLRALLIHNDKETEVWVMESTKRIGGPLLLEGVQNVKSGGKLIIDWTPIKERENWSLLRISGDNDEEGWIRLEAELSSEVEESFGKKKSLKSGEVLILVLNEKSVKTLQAHWMMSSSNSNSSIKSDKKRWAPDLITWGSYNVFMDPITGDLDLTSLKQDDRLSIFTANTSFKYKEFKENSNEFNGLPFIYSYSLPSNGQSPELPKLSSWEIHSVEWNSMPWIPLETNSKGTKPIQDVIGLHFTSGFVGYRIKISLGHYSNKTMSPGSIRVGINMRHKCQLFVDGTPLKGHTTYSHQILNPGSKIGPDFGGRFGSQEYDISNLLKIEDKKKKNYITSLHDIIILVENFGMNRQAFFFNDAKNPRGLLSLHFKCSHGIHLLEIPQWEVIGVDTRTLSNPFESCGIPVTPWKNDHNSHQSLTWTGILSLKSLPISSHWTWLKSHFMITSFPSSNLNLGKSPLRLKLLGKGVFYIWLNEHLIGRWYGQEGDSPQHDFYLQDGWIKKEKNQKNELVLGGYVWDEGGIHVQLQFWNIELQSGNLKEEGGDPVVFWHHHFQRVT